jgi:type I restriction enzyme S subunit
MQNNKRIKYVPEGWEEKRLDEVADFFNGKGHEKDIDENGNYVVVNSKFISTNGRVRKYSNEFLVPLKIGDVTMVMSDVPNGKAIAKCFFVDENNKYTLNQRIGGFKSKNALNKFLQLIINRNRYFLSYDDGVSRTNLRKDDILACPLLLPPLPEQSRIVAVLETWDAAIEKLSRQIEIKKSIKKGLMQELMTGKKRLPGFSDEWVNIGLGEISQIHDGTHQTPKYVESGIPFYSVEHLTANQFLKTKFISKEVFETEIKKVKIERNDILMTRIGDIGTAKYIDWDVEASFYVTLALFKTFNKNICNRFLAYLINSQESQREIWGKTIHVAFPNKINLGDINKCKVIMPKQREEQETIAQILTTADDEITTLQQKLQLLEDQKKFLLNNLITGKIRTPEDLIISNS